MGKGAETGKGVPERKIERIKKPFPRQSLTEWVSSRTFRIDYVDFTFLFSFLGCTFFLCGRDAATCFRLDKKQGFLCSFFTLALFRLYSARGACA